MLKCLRNQMLVWMLFSIMLPCMAAAKEIGKPPAVAAPSWFGKVPTIQQQLEFHTFKQALEESHDLRKQAAFEKAHLRFLRNPEQPKCSFIDCGVRVHQEFEGTILYLLTVDSQGSESRHSLVFSVGPESWHETHRFCSNCNEELQTGMLELAESFQAYAQSVKPFPEAEKKNNLLQSQTTDPSEKQILNSRMTSSGIEKSGFKEEKNMQGAQKRSPATSQKSLLVKKEPDQSPKTKLELNQPETVQSGIVHDGTQSMTRTLAMLKPTPEEGLSNPIPLKPKPEKKITKKRFSIDLLRFRLAEKKYNQLIWRGIKRKMMFFRQENRYRLQASLKAKIRLSIDATGKVIWKKMMHPSRSSVFNRRVLESVSMLSLPPPTDILVRDPPYVVTIIIEP